MVSKTTVFGRSNLNAKNFDFGMRAFAFPQKAWPRLGGGGVPPWGPSMEFKQDNEGPWPPMMVRGRIHSNTSGIYEVAQYRRLMK